MIPEILFRPPPPDLELADGDAHVFCAALDQPLPRLERFAKILSDDERARAARFVFERDRNRFVAGRGLLREILGWLLPAEPASLVFAYGDHGKPRLTRPVGRRFLHFNVAHSDELIVCLVSAQDEVGIDLERIRPVQEAEEIAERFFSAREIAEWRAQPANRRWETFFKFWTRQEACVKAFGCGLGGLPGPAGGRRLRSSAAAPNQNFRGSTPTNWWFHALTPAFGYTGAAALKHRTVLNCWKYPPATNPRSGASRS